ncbi:MAG: Hsp20/alpha crystallin family protein [Candidatus Levybacteria bacterium]|nr:Hsp20/alpha crystallin family protein [Candidatus Levybacteria bacterium]MBP9814778.1 Hsp20/alpha crystallin family protein [Candidatus Levybacteria bacterium]
MAIIRWNPWNIDRFFEDDFDLPTIPGISRLMGQGLNLYETEESIISEAALPGVSEDKIDVTFENGVVRVTASIEDKKEEKEKRRYFMSSMTSSFNYSFRIPEGVVETSEPEAVLEDGVLRLTFKKVVKKEPKKIKVSKKVKSIK